MVWILNRITLFRCITSISEKILAWYFHFEKIVMFRWLNRYVFTLIRSERTNQHVKPDFLSKFQKWKYNSNIFFLRYLWCIWRELCGLESTPKNIFLFSLKGFPPTSCFDFAERQSRWEWKHAKREGPIDEWWVVV